MGKENSLRSFPRRFFFPAAVSSAGSRVASNGNIATHTGGGGKRWPSLALPRYRSRNHLRESRCAPPGECRATINQHREKHGDAKRSPVCVYPTQPYAECISARLGPTQPFEFLNFPRFSSWPLVLFAYVRKHARTSSHITEFPRSPAKIVRRFATFAR